MKTKTTKELILCGPDLYIECPEDLVEVTTYLVTASMNINHQVECLRSFIFDLEEAGLIDNGEAEDEISDCRNQMLDAINRVTADLITTRTRKTVEDNVLKLKQ